MTAETTAEVVALIQKHLTWGVYQTMRAHRKKCRELRRNIAELRRIRRGLRRQLETNVQTFAAVA